ncbi:hypothetical protein [Gaetbulibacter sp. NE]|jgi:hypothetical protein|uniref:hypothetical protein n=1 Tax=Gaetbulibacter sp. NE TaxID=2982307 RepID=UPI0021D1E469|nr:hypothetical protein [Gaetbulibacter sp. NE]
MYYHEAYIKFQNQYLRGLKSITQKTAYPSISISKQPKGKLKITSHSFKAFFNEKGKLIHLNNLHPRANNKFSYYYDNQNRLVKIIEVDKISNALIRENNIKHQDKLNFVEYIREYIDKSYERIREIHHSKEYDSICVEQKNVPMDEWYLHQTIEFDDYREEILDADCNWQDVSIYELNRNKQVVKSYYHSFDYNDDGEVIETEDKFEPKDYYLHTYYGSGLIKSDSYISEEPWTKTYEYKFNEKGHWVEKVTCIDDSLQFICERKLDYY